MIEFNNDHKTQGDMLQVCVFPASVCVPQRIR